METNEKNNGDWGPKKDCQSCLWASVECKNGSMYKEQNKSNVKVKCANWAYYD